jgi:hypothetical protein
VRCKSNRTGSGFACMLSSGSIGILPVHYFERADRFQPALTTRRIFLGTVSQCQFNTSCDMISKDNQPNGFSNQPNEFRIELPD